MSTCIGKLSLSMKLTESLVDGPSTTIEIRIQRPKSKSGPATLHIARICRDRTLMTEVKNLLSRAESLGGAEVADAAIRIFDRYDREPSGAKHPSGFAI